MKIGQLVGKLPLQKLHKPSELLVDSATLLGVEIEVENCVKLYDATEPSAAYWYHKEDHSLRNNGREFVFAEPLFGSDAVQAIDFICKSAFEYKWKISSLTGIHTHVDVRDMEIEVFRNLCITYALIEPLLYNWVGNGRANNIFCMPWYMAEGDLMRISSLIKHHKENLDGAAKYIKTFHKYSGLNLASLAQFGTIEFRMLKTTFDRARIIDWLNIILSIKKYAITNATSSADDIFHRVKKFGALHFATQVFGNTLLQKMWYPEYTKDILGLGGPIADWFLDNSKDLFIKNNGTIFDWAKRKLVETDDNTQGEHKGLSTYRAKKAAAAANPKLEPIVVEKKEPKKKKGPPPIVNPWAGLMLDEAPKAPALDAAWGAIPPPEGLGVFKFYIDENLNAKPIKEEDL